jgi:hypothetical protein
MAFSRETSGADAHVTPNEKQVTLGAQLHAAAAHALILLSRTTDADFDQALFPRDINDATVGVPGYIEM